MPTTTRPDLSAVPDLYGVLGVDAAAGGDDIARAFRVRAKQLHPDTNPDTDAAAKFSELVAAYGVLSNHRTRREYDSRRSAAARVPAAIRSSAAGAGTAPTPHAPLGSRWTRRRAWTALVAGTVVAVLGVGALWLTWQLHESDGRRRAEYVAVNAARVGADDIAFITADGRTVRTREPVQHGEGTDVGPRVKVRYDPKNPTHVIVDQSNVGRDITLAIVSLKFLIGGPVFVVLGARRLRTAG